MPGLRDVLQRFRPAGAPGAATAAGVPADRRADVTAELEPVFAALADIQQECARVGADGAQRASRLRTEAAEESRTILVRARGEITAERARAVAERVHDAEQELAGIDATADRNAAEVRRRTARLLPGLVEQVVERVRAELAEVAPDETAEVPR